MSIPQYVEARELLRLLVANAAQKIHELSKQYFGKIPIFTKIKVIKMFFYTT